LYGTFDRSGRNQKETILKALSTGDYVSGERLSREMKVTRPAVWKHIGQLKEDGFVIEAHKGKGYRLKSIPDILFPDLIRQQINTRSFGQKIHHFLRTDSTNRQARNLASEGASEGTLVVAEYQEKGKGRFSRVWESPSGQNLLFSLILRPNWPPRQAFYGTVLASVSLCRAIQEIVDIPVGIKWPNDIYCRDKKLAGILTEFTTDPDRLEYMIIGIGVNCHWAPAEVLQGGQPATSILQEAGKKISRLQLLARFLTHGEALYEKARIEGVGFLREEWDRYSLIKNRRVTILAGQTPLTGVAQGIDDHGGLILLLDDGRKETILTGDVHLRF
jgi:BirA family biotin operon repressor/biotin-[acetyl-CoA-carboxylase] ligase